MSKNLLGLTENPFAAGHDPRLVHATPERAEILARFRNALGTGEPFILITGEPGIGKTSVVSEALSEGSTWAAVITNPKLTCPELLEEICLRFGVDLPKSPSKPQLLARLERHLGEIRREGATPVLVVDEAHDLSLELLEELRLLSNLEASSRPLFQIVLVGLPELEGRLAQPGLEQLRQRISVHGRLAPLSAEESERYIHHRVAMAGGDGPERFARETCLEIHRLARGIPRAINTLAGQALLGASRESARAVTLGHVQAAAADTWLRSVSDGAGAAPDPRPKPSPSPPRREPPKPESVRAEPSPQPSPSPLRHEPPKPKPEPVRVEQPPPIPPPTRREPAKPEPVRAEPLQSVAGLAATDAPEPSAMPRPAKDPDVKAWVSRFVDPQKPVQIGARAPLVRQTVERLPDAEARTDLTAGPIAGAARPQSREAKREGWEALRELRREFRLDPRRLTIAAAAVFALAAAVVILPSMGRHQPTAPQATAANQKSAAPLTRLRRDDSAGPRSAARAARVSSTSDPATAPKPSRRHGIEVASYLSAVRAHAESARLASVSGHSARTIAATEDGATVYRVVLGSFGSRRKAVRAADDLVNQGLVDQARVVALPADATTR